MIAVSRLYRINAMLLVSLGGAAATDGSCRSGDVVSAANEPEMNGPIRDKQFPVSEDSDASNGVHGGPGGIGSSGAAGSWPGR
jgi:hypothetical protein